MITLHETEANVVIVITNNWDEIEVHPFWEYEGDTESIRQLAATLTLDFVEKMGHGAASARIFDRRAT